MDLIGPIDPPAQGTYGYILCLVDPGTLGGGEAMPVTSLGAK
ncbi:hypothetical protein TNCV_3319521, partial [Trichonephila clavipes]